MGFDLFLMLLYVGGALSISFTCSVLEATLLSSRVTELSSRAQQGQRGAARLLDLKQNRMDDAISAILTLNTIAHTIGSAMAGAQAAIVFGDAWVGVFSGVLTLLVLVVTEIIPKTLGTTYASSLAGLVGRTIGLLIVALAPVLVLTRFLTRLVAPRHHQPISRAELAALVAMATEEGTIKTQAAHVLTNTLRLDEIRVADVMTPRTVAQMLPADSPARMLLTRDDSKLFSRIPLFGESRDDVVGYVVLREALLELARSPEAGTQTLRTFLHEAWFVDMDEPLGAALRHFLQRRQHLALVQDSFGAVVGLLTLEDIVETVLGREIVDESDQIPDLRELAMQLRDQRTARRHGAATGSDHDAPASAAQLDVDTSSAER